MHTLQALSPQSNTYSWREFLLELLVVLGASCFGHEPFRQLLQVPGILRLYFGFLPKEVLQVLEQLNPHLRLLLEAFLLLHQLSSDL